MTAETLSQERQLLRSKISVELLALNTWGDEFLSKKPSKLGTAASVAFTVLPFIQRQLPSLLVLGLPLLLKFTRKTSPGWMSYGLAFLLKEFLPKR